MPAPPNGSEKRSNKHCSQRGYLPDALILAWTPSFEYHQNNGTLAHVSKHYGLEILVRGSNSFAG